MPSEIKRLKQLEEENKRLKKLVADLSLALDREMLQDFIRRKIWAKRRKSPTRRPRWRQPTRVVPRIAGNAVTAGAIDQLGSNSSICRVSRASRCSASWMA
jgi:hypothetical protein